MRTPVGLGPCLALTLDDRLNVGVSAPTLIAVLHAIRVRWFIWLWLWGAHLLLLTNVRVLRMQRFPGMSDACPDCVDRSWLAVEGARALFRFRLPSAAKQAKKNRARLNRGHSDPLTVFGRGSQMQSASKLRCKNPNRKEERQGWLTVFEEA